MDDNIAAEKFFIQILEDSAFTVDRETRAATKRIHNMDFSLSWAAPDINGNFIAHISNEDCSITLHELRSDQKTLQSKILTYLSKYDLHASNAHVEATGKHPHNYNPSLS